MNKQISSLIADGILTEVPRHRVMEQLQAYGEMIQMVYMRSPIAKGEVVAPQVEIVEGNRYAKVRLGRWIHTFVDLRNGDILKAGSYKAPAPNGVRGNIFATDLGESCVDWHGAKYLK